MLTGNKGPNKNINPTHFSMAEIVFRFTITQFQPLKNAQIMEKTCTQS